MFLLMEWKDKIKVFLIVRILGVHRLTVSSFVKRNNKIQV